MLEQGGWEEEDDGYVRAAISGRGYNTYTASTVSRR